jgi:peptide/nickel transport system substrate-binding protein/oligopeptide transport system substrate-binding protein
MAGPGTTPVRKYLCLVFGTFGAWALSRCSTAAPDRTLQYALSQDPRSLDPALSTDVPTGEMVTLLYDNLVQQSVEGTVVPGLARRWTIDSTGSLYVFTLRSGVKFHDGATLTAATVRSSILRALAPGSSGGRGWPLYPIQGAREYAAGAASDVSGITTPDDSTVVMKLEEPLNIFLTLLAMPVAAVVPSTAGTELGDHPVGTGPWRFVSWSHDDAIIFRRERRVLGHQAPIRFAPRSHHSRGADPGGGIRIGKTQRGRGALRRDRALGSDARGGAAAAPALRALYVAINTRRGPLADPRVRRALNLAVDRDAILRNVAGGRGVLAAGTIPPGLAGHDSTRRPYPFDPEAAKRLLAEAGHPALRIQLWRSSRPIYARIAQAIQQDLASAGVTVEILERDAASARAAARNGEADLFLTDWYGDYPDPENFTYPLLHSRNPGAAGEPGVSARRRARHADSPGPCHARHGAQVAAHAGNRSPRLRDGTVDLLLVPGRPVGDAKRRGGLANSRGLQRTALGRGARAAVIRYLAARLLLLVPTLAGVLAVTFFLLYIAPGDPVQAMVGERADPETIARLRAELRLDDPLPTRFLHYTSGVLRGDLGTSYITRRPSSMTC